MTNPPHTYSNSHAHHIFMTMYAAETVSLDFQRRRIHPDAVLPRGALLPKVLLLRHGSVFTILHSHLLAILWVYHPTMLVSTSTPPAAPSVSSALRGSRCPSSSVPNEVLGASPVHHQVHIVVRTRAQSGTSSLGSFTNDHTPPAVYCTTT